jgi:hypothetical protein
MLGGGEPVKAPWVEYPDRVRGEAQKTPGEFFGNMPVDRKIDQINIGLAA